MAKADDGGAAFPRPASTMGSYDPQPGMSLRDWFAGQVLVGLLSETGFKNKLEVIAAQAYEMADAMLAEREK